MRSPSRFLRVYIWFGNLMSRWSQQHVTHKAASYRWFPVPKQWAQRSSKNREQDEESLPASAFVSTGAQTPNKVHTP